nr:hypothetical protein [Tanacetum cinerariifolium]
MNALVDQGSDVKVMPLSTYEKLINERHAVTNVRLSLASHSYIYPLGIAEDVLVNVVGYVYPVDFVILDIKEDKKGEEGINADDNATSDDSIERPDGLDAKVQLNKVKKKNKAKNWTKNKEIKSVEKEPTQVEEEESMKAPSS